MDSPRYSTRAVSALRHLELAAGAADNARRAMLAEAKAAQKMREAVLDVWIVAHSMRKFALADTLRDILKAGGWRIAGGHKDAKDGRADYYLEQIIESPAPSAPGGGQPTSAPG